MKGNKQYRIYQIPLLAFFSRGLYRDVAHNWKGTAFGYLLLLLALCWIPATVGLHWAVAEFVDQDAPKVVSQVPEVTIVDGEASIDAPEPYLIRDPDTGKVLMVIDTTGQITALADTEVMGLLTKNAVIFKKSAYETRNFSLREVDSFVLTQEKIYGWLDLGKRFLAPLLYPFCVIGSFIYRILQALLYAAIGLLIARIVKTDLPYDGLLRLSVVAVTPAIIVATILTVAGIHPPMGGLWYFLATMAYLIFGIRAAKAEEERTFEFS